jgi:hypothetical protein
MGMLLAPRFDLLKNLIRFQGEAEVLVLEFENLLKEIGFSKR